MTLSEEKKETIKVSALMVVGATLGKILSLPTGIITAAILGPGLLGKFAIVRLIVSCASYTQLGFLTSVARNGPLAYGRGDLQDVKRITNTAFTAFSILSAITILALWGLYFSGLAFFDSFDLTLLVVVSIIIAFSKANSFLYAVIRSEGKFMVFGKLDFVSQLLVPVLTLVLVYFFKFYGMVLALLLNHAIMTGLSYYWLEKPKFNFSVHVDTLKSLWQSGSLLYLNKVMDSVFMNIGVFVAASMMATSAVGLFSFATVIISGENVPFADGFLVIISRKMLVEAGRSGTENKNFFRKYLERYYSLFSLLVSFFIGNMMILQFFLVDVYLKKFSGSLPVMLILFAGYLVYASRLFLFEYLSATNQLHRRLRVLLIGLLVNMALSYTLVSRGFGIMGVAIACSAGFLFISLNMIFEVYKQVYGSTRYTLLFIGKLLIMSAALTGMLLLFYTYKFFPYLHFETMSTRIVVGALDTLVKGVLYTAWCVGVHVFLFKKFGIQEEIGNFLHYAYDRVRAFLPIKASTGC